MHDDEKLMIKVDSEDQGVDYQTETKFINKFGLMTNIKIPTISVLLSMKINAFMSRIQGRDLYDISYLLSRTQPDYNFLSKKLEITNAANLREAMLSRLKTMDQKILLHDLERFLFNPKQDRVAVRNFAEIIQSIT